MPSVEELSKTLEAALTVAGTDAKTIERRPDSTIIPHRRADTGGKRAFALLGEMAEIRSTLLELHGTIGEGGMGIVRVGIQRALGRAVAVKTLREEHVGDDATLKLLREAWVTGSLEHPNVVPVYDIALDASGKPQIILKKIEGVEWGELMHDPAAIRARFSATDPLDWNLRILMQVCNAVRFAHSRGILHRDLKPENVMIGAFGEVYVVDWGIAVALHDDGTGRIPLASEAKQIAGTPVYMAPEMLGGPVSKLSERSDVYLLGSVLYEICVGDAPHRGEAFMELVAAIVDSDPDIPDSVPPELARIIRHAMRADPDARFENVEQFRLAISGFLSHRDGMILAERAADRLAELERLLEAAREDEEARARIAPLFSECRFAFRHSLEVWPENDIARRGLDRVLTTMVEHELEDGRASHAKSMLDEIASPAPELVARVEHAAREEVAERARLQQLAAQHDYQTGRRTRAFVASIVGGVWTISPFVFHFLFQTNQVRPWHGLALSGVMATLIGGLGVWARESMLRTQINRIVGGAAIVVVFVQAAVAAGALVMDRSPMIGLHDGFITWAAIAAMAGITVEKRFLFSALAYLIGYFVLGAIGHEHLFLVMAICNLSVPLVAFFAWGKLTEELSDARQRIERRREARRAGQTAELAADSSPPP